MRLVLRSSRQGLRICSRQRRKSFCLLGKPCINLPRWRLLSKGGCPSALKSPQILELSGIGNRSVLEKIRVPVKVDLPAVGENVQEHMFVGISWGEPSRNCQLKKFHITLSFPQNSATTSPLTPSTF